MNVRQNGKTAIHIQIQQTNMNWSRMQISHYKGEQIPVISGVLFFPSTETQTQGHLLIHVVDQGQIWD